MSDLAMNSSYGDWNRAVIANRAQLYGGAKKGFSRLRSEPVQQPAASVVTHVEEPVTETVVATEAAMPEALLPSDIQAPAEIAVAPAARRRERPAFYAGVTALLTALGVMSVWFANQKFAPEMYGNGMVPVAEAFAKGENYGVFDLNINIRKLRDEHVSRMTKTPELVVLGASQWQEANKAILPDKDWYNSHIHRDYWEDLLAMVYLWESHGHLPKQMIITIRDNQFLPLEDRKDFLWEPGIPYYRVMADRLGLEKQSWWGTLPKARFRERFSLSMLFENVTRWYNAEQTPHASTEMHFKSLDTLLPDGSILWSADHKAIFTPERARRETLALADYKIKHPPKVDPKGVADLDRLLTHLKEKNVEVYLAHPPYNPIFFDYVQDTPYLPAMRRIEQIVQDLADKHGLKVIGGFSPYKVGCRADQYIDAEHSSPDCIGRILKEFAAIEAGSAALRGTTEAN